jgi:hypothetical protein
MPQERPLENFDDVARLLRTLSPAGQIDRDRVMYLSGRQSAAIARPAPTAWAWPAATGLATTVAAILAIVLASRPDAAVEPAAEGPQNASDATALLANNRPSTDLLDPPHSSSYARLRRELLGGVLPAQSVADVAPHERDTVRPRSFDILSHDGMKL